MEEIWKPVVGYEGLYEVSNLGNVKSVDREIKTKRGSRKYKSKIRKPSKKEDGYELIYLCKYGISTPFYIHRLVAESFIPNLENKKEVDHIIPIMKGGTNEAANLRWTDRSGNMKNPLTLDKISRKNNHNYGKIGSKHHSSKPILQYSKDGEFIREWDCIMDVQRELGICQNNISACARGKLGSCGGYVWRYKNEVA